MTEDATLSRIRRIYDERIVPALWFGLFAILVLTPLFFLARWGGYRGKLKPWGDRIPLRNAVPEVPEIAALCFGSGRRCLRYLPSMEIVSASVLREETTRDSCFS